MPLFIVFITVCTHQVPALPRVEPRRDAVVDQSVALVFIDFLGIGKLNNGADSAEIEIGNRELRVSQKMIGEHDHRHLVFVRQVEGLHDLVKGIVGIGWGQYQLGKFPMPRVNRKQELSLASPGGKASGRTRSLGEDDYQGGLRHSRQADPLYHQGEAAARGGGHGPCAGIARTERHVHSRYLVFCLFGKYAQPIPMQGKKGNDPCRRSHGERQPAKAAARGIASFPEIR